MAGHSKWANIQHRKNRQDERRGKLFPRLIMASTAAARRGGGDATSNPRLRLALDKASDEFKTYRQQMGPRLRRDDPSEQYLRDLDRMIQRTRRRMERDAQRAREEAAETTADPAAPTGQETAP